MELRLRQYVVTIRTEAWPHVAKIDVDARTDAAAVLLAAQEYYAMMQGKP